MATIFNQITHSEESQLDSGIEFTAPTLEHSIQPAALLLSGAAGFLGAHLLDALLRFSRARVYCLVSASDPVAAEACLQQQLERYGLWESSRRDRMVVVQGELAESRLGLSPEAFAALAAEVESLYHCEDSADWVVPASQARFTCARGVQELLRLAATGRTKPFHLVTTQDSLLSRRRARVMNTEVDDPSGPGSQALQSCVEAEELVSHAMMRGLPATLHRVAPVMGHSETGTVGHDEGLFYAILRGVTTLNQYPAVESAMPIVPVDYACATVVSRSLQAGAFGKTFHITDPEPGSWSTFFEHFAAMGYALQQVTQEEWFAEISRRAQREPSNVLYQQLQRLATLCGSDLSRQPVLEASGVREEQVYAGFEWPPVDMNLIGTYVRFLQQLGLIPRPDRAVFTEFTNKLLSVSREVKETQTFVWEGMNFVAYPTVFFPDLFKDTFFFIRQIPIHPGESVLELGCGAGLLSVVAALKGASQVVAADINPAAVENTLENARIQGVEGKVRAYAGDMFTALPEQQRFDLVFSNVPYVAVIDKASDDDRSLEVLAMHDPGYQAIEAYFREGGKYVKPGGRLLIGFSSSVGDVGLLHAFAKKYHWSLRRVTSKRFPNARFYSLEIYQLVAKHVQREEQTP